MFRIAICDDERVFNESMEEYISEYMEYRNYPYSIDAFTALFELEHAQKEQKYDLLFLDIMIRSDSGMEYAKLMREKGDDTNIVFVSSNTDYALEAFSIYPVTFLAKPIDKKDVHALLDRILLLYLKRPTIMINDKFKGRTVVQYESILYLESMGHDIVMQLNNGDTLRFAGVFSEFVQQLPSSYFFKCHRSYTVNMSFVHRLQNYRFVMTDGSISPIAKPSYKEAQDRFASMIGAL